MSPLPSHGKNADMLADWVKTLLKHQGQDWEAFTPITLKMPNQQGVEPDYCFYVQSRQAILGKERLDLTQDPPPDLVIEVDLTSTTRVEDYLAIGAKELWVYQRDQLRIHLFEDQQYRETETSMQFPRFPVKELVYQYMQRGWQEGSSVALRAFEQWLTQHHPVS
jgi:Uma2 family endonuclease